MKLTVSEYAAEFKTSVQSVYQRIKRGSLKSVEENGIKYVVVEKESIKDDLKPELKNEFKEALKQAFKIIKQQQKQIEAKDKEIKRLTKSLEKAQNAKSEVLEKFIFEMQRLAAPVPEEEIIDVKDKKKKKHKKKKH